MNAVNLGHLQVRHVLWLKSLILPFPKEMRIPRIWLMRIRAILTLQWYCKVSILSLCLLREPRKSQEKFGAPSSPSDLFFQKSPNLSTGAENSSTNASPSQAEPNTSSYSNGSHAPGDKSSSPRHCQLNPSAGSQYQEKGNDGSLAREKNNIALLEWQRIQQLMRNSIPVCKGHKEPCVSRIVKKPGPTFGHRFFVCSRAEGPVSNPEANCGYFKWASSKSQRKWPLVVYNVNNFFWHFLWNFRSWFVFL